MALCLSGLRLVFPGNVPDRDAEKQSFRLAPPQSLCRAESAGRPAEKAVSLSEPRSGEFAKSPAGAFGQRGEPEGSRRRDASLCLLSCAQESRSPQRAKPSSLRMRKVGLSRHWTDRLSVADLHCHWPGFAPAGDSLSCLCKKVSKEAQPTFASPSAIPNRLTPRAACFANSPCGLRQRSPCFRPRACRLALSRADQACHSGEVRRPDKRSAIRHSTAGPSPPCRRALRLPEMVEDQPAREPTARRTTAPTLSPWPKIEHTTTA